MTMQWTYNLDRERKDTQSILFRNFHLGSSQFDFKEDIKIALKYMNLGKQFTKMNFTGLGCRTVASFGDGSLGSSFTTAGYSQYNLLCPRLWQIEITAEVTFLFSWPHGSIHKLLVATTADQ